MNALLSRPTIAKGQRSEPRKLRSWFGFSKASAAAPAAAALVFFADGPLALAAYETLVEFVVEHGLERVGIFRVPGNARVVADASAKLDLGVDCRVVLDSLGERQRPTTVSIYNSVGV